MSYSKSEAIGLMHSARDHGYINDSQLKSAISQINVFPGEQLSSDDIKRILKILKVLIDIILLILELRRPRQSIGPRMGSCF